MKNIEELVCPHVLKMRPYSSARSEYKGQATVFLDANENTLKTNYNRYPDPLQGKLKIKIGTLLDVAPNQIFLGNGSDEAIDLLLRIFCRAGEDQIITLPPTYGMYKVSADLNNVETVEVPLKDNFQPDVTAILAAQNARTKLLFICSPNNPTGNDIKLDLIEELIQKFDGIVVVDEAYIHFSMQRTCLDWLAIYPNLVVLQTFSKAWGMAGVRLGIAVSSPKIVGLFNKVKPPYNINALTQEFVLRELGTFNDFQKDVLAIKKERASLKKALLKLDLVKKIYPSSANFLLVKVPKANQIYQCLIEAGIVIRNRSTVLLCDNCLRISIGTATENKQIIDCLANFDFLSQKQKKIKIIE